jgi:hypothetical protein
MYIYKKHNAYTQFLEQNIDYEMSVLVQDTYFRIQEKSWNTMHMLQIYVNHLQNSLYTFIFSAFENAQA